MGSVYVRWEGTCPQIDRQQELIGYLQELGARCEQRLQSPPARPAFLELMSGTREQDSPKIPVVRMFDEEITGRIVLDPCLARDAQSLQSDVQRLQPEMIAIDGGGLEKNEAFCLSLGSGGAQWCLGLKRIQVHGIDFRVFDPRNLYPSADRISFVFLSCPELPALDGCLAQIENHEQVQAYQSDAIRAADWYVSAPSIHLRYYLEEWSDLLLTWIKQFFVPDLAYHRYEEMSQYDALSAVVQQMIDEHGEDFAKRSLFQYLLESFEREADEWIQKMAQMR